MTLVLVVDDAAPLAEQYAYDLRRMGGYEVLTAPDGARALEDALAAGKERGAAGVKAIESAFKATADACVQCHAKHRDVPKR